MKLLRRAVSGVSTAAKLEYEKEKIYFLYRGHRMPL
jgi:hypothetical protein